MWGAGEFIKRRRKHFTDNLLIHALHAYSFKKLKLLCLKVDQLMNKYNVVSCQRQGKAKALCFNSSSKFWSPTPPLSSVQPYFSLNFKEGHFAFH